MKQAIFQYKDANCLASGGRLALFELKSHSSTFNENLPVFGDFGAFQEKRSLKERRQIIEK